MNPPPVLPDKRTDQRFPQNPGGQSALLRQIFLRFGNRSGKIADNLYRIIPYGCLPCHHHRSRPVTYRVENITDLRPCGYAAVLHTGQHLGNHHKGSSGKAAGAGDPLLNAGQFPQGHGVAQVSPGDYNLIAGAYQLLQIGNTLPILYLGKKADTASAGSVNVRKNTG